MEAAAAAGATAAAPTAPVADRGFIKRAISNACYGVACAGSGLKLTNVPTFTKLPPDELARLAARNGASGDGGKYDGEVVHGFYWHDEWLLQNVHCDEAKKVAALSPAERRVFFRELRLQWYMLAELPSVPVAAVQTIEQLARVLVPEGVTVRGRVVRGPEALKVFVVRALRAAGYGEGRLFQEAMYILSVQRALCEDVITEAAARVGLPPAALAARFVEGLFAARRVTEPVYVTVTLDKDSGKELPSYLHHRELVHSGRYPLLEDIEDWHVYRRCVDSALFAATVGASIKREYALKSSLIPVSDLGSAWWESVWAITRTQGRMEAEDAVTRAKTTAGMCNACQDDPAHAPLRRPGALTGTTCMHQALWYYDVYAAIPSPDSRYEAETWEETQWWFAPTLPFPPAAV